MPSANARQSADVAGGGSRASNTDAPIVFHLPLPPLAGAGARAVHALERRAKKAYFAVLDAMRTGIVDADRAAQVSRLAGEARARRSGDTASEALDQLVWGHGPVAAASPARIASPFVGAVSRTRHRRHVSIGVRLGAGVH